MPRNLSPQFREDLTCSRLVVLGRGAVLSSVFQFKGGYLSESMVPFDFGCSALSSRGQDRQQSAPVRYRVFRGRTDNADGDLGKQSDAQRAARRLRRSDIETLICKTLYIAARMTRVAGVSKGRRTRRGAGRDIRNRRWRSKPRCGTVFVLSSRQVTRNQSMKLETALDCSEPTFIEARNGGAGVHGTLHRWSRPVPRNCFLVC